MRFAFLLPVIGCAIATPVAAQSQYQAPISPLIQPRWDNINNIDNSIYFRPHGARYGYVQVRKLIQQGDYAQADKMLNGIMGGTSDREARFLKGVTSLALNKPEAARRYFERVLVAGRSGHPGAMSGLALAEIRLGNADAARDILRKLQYQQEKCGSSCDRAGSIRQAIGVVEKALA